MAANLRQDYGSLFVVKDAKSTSGSIGQNRSQKLSTVLVYSVEAN